MPTHVITSWAPFAGSLGGVFVNPQTRVAADWHPADHPDCVSYFSATDPATYEADDEGRVLAIGVPPTPIVLGSRYVLSGVIASVHDTNPVRGPLFSFGCASPTPYLQPLWVRELHDGRVVYLWPVTED